MRWAASVQRELLKVDWPEGVLEWAECAPESDEDGLLLWRGLRVKVGMAVGHDAAKRPLNTGATRSWNAGYGLHEGESQLAEGLPADLHVGTRHAASQASLPVPTCVRCASVQEGLITSVRCPTWRREWRGWRIPARS